MFSNASTGDIIPESHIGGHTYADDFVTITFNSRATIKTDDVILTLCHEPCHATRWQYNNEWSSTLLASMVFEGIATAFVENIAQTNTIAFDYFTKVIVKTTDITNERIFSILKDQLASEIYDYTNIFFVGDKNRGLPRWAGYSLGYYLVKKYMPL